MSLATCESSSAAAKTKSTTTKCASPSTFSKSSTITHQDLGNDRLVSSGQSINSTNLQDLRSIETQDFYSFTHVKPPKGLNEAALKAMFVGILGRDLSKQLKDPTTYTSLVGAATDWARKTVTLLNKIQGGYTKMGIEIISEKEAREYRISFTAFSGFCDKLANYNTEAKMKNFQFSVDDVKGILEAKPLIEKIEKQLDEITHFSEDISYLQQCKQYVTDEAFKQEITTAINQLASILSSGNQGEIDAYNRQLSKLKEQYADWYLKLYLKYRISEADNTKKDALIDSVEKAICDILKEADFLSTGQYQQWINRVNKLQPADSIVNKDLILTAPYQEFNPIDFEGAEITSVKQAKEDLTNLLENWEQTLKDTLEDPMVKKNRSLLGSTQNALLDKFESGKIVLSKDNAIGIRNAIMSLYEGLEKIELTMESMKATFNKPLTPDEAVSAFKVYVDELAKGKERDKIRIILK